MDERLESMINQDAIMYKTKPSFEVNRFDPYARLENNLNTYLSQHPEDADVMIKVLGKIISDTNDNKGAKELLAIETLSNYLRDGIVERALLAYNHLKENAEAEQKANGTKGYAATTKLEVTPPPEQYLTDKILQTVKQALPKNYDSVPIIPSQADTLRRDAIINDELRREEMQERAFQRNAPSL